MPSHWYGILAAIFSVGAQFVLFLRWLHRRMHNDRVLRASVSVPHGQWQTHRLGPDTEFAEAHKRLGANRRQT